MTRVSDMKLCLRVFLSFVSILVLLPLMGCEQSDYYDHVPASGKGSLVVDNNSGNNISVFVDGAKIMAISGGDYDVADLTPGSFRIVISSDNAYQSYSGYLDIIEKYLTILEVRPSSTNNFYSFDVITTYY